MNNRGIRSLLLCLALSGLFAADDAFADPSPAAQFVTVTGGVVAPGRVPWAADLTLLWAIDRAGGMDSHYRDIWLVRGEKSTRFKFRTLRGDPRLDPTLQPGDTIKVGGP